MGGLRRFLTFFIPAIILVSLTSSSAAQSVDREFIGDPGKWVSGPFLAYYHSAKDPQALFGSPITIEFSDPATGQRVQYFEKARFDLTQSTGGATVTSADLGRLLYVDGQLPEAGIGGDPVVCHRFPSGLESCYAFWQFYQAQDGETFLGQPLSNTLSNPGGFLVQYFEKGLLEWHPERPGGQRVTAASLGSLYFNEFVGDAAYTRTAVEGLPPDLERAPHANVYLSNAIVPANSNQTIYVVAADQYQQPISGATVGVSITLPDGRQSFFRLPETNASGISTLDLSIGDMNPRDVIVIDAEVTAGGQTINAGAWFRIWW